MSSSQSESEICFWHIKKKWYIQSEWQTMFFHVWEKWYVQSEVTEVCEFRTKIPALNRGLQLAAPSLCESFADI